ncbi:MAG: GGDEF domain-containing protein [Hyphomonadaceae bacterium]
MISLDSGVTRIHSKENRQRQRLMRLYVFAMIVNLVIGVSQGVALGGAAILALVVCGIVSVICIIGFMCAHYGWHAIAVARIGLYVTMLAVFWEISLSGGMGGYVAPILTLMPLMSALVLSARDTIVFIMFSMIGIGALCLYNEALPVFLIDADTYFLGNSLTIMWATVGVGFVAFMMVRDGDAIEVQLQRLVELQTHFALHDSLTGLGNRAAVNGFLDKLDPNKDHVNLFLIDLDGFKQVNDQFGHAAGDDVLVTVAERMKKIAGNARLLARLGGDEFLIAVDAPASNMSHPFSFGHRLVEALSISKQQGGVELTITASVGSAQFPTDSTSTSELLSKADTALYVAKKAGKGRYVSSRPKRPAPKTWIDKRAAS